ncbi:C3 and PZP-like alpha-2-macroglobulin domain-containing 8 isoform X2, partial [Paramuricea clavata]
MSRHLALILLAAAFSSAVETEKPQYLITSPYTYRAGEDETVNIQLFGSKSCEVEVRLKPQNSKTVTVSANGTFTPGEQGKLILRIPKENVRNGRHYYRTSFDLDATVCGVKTESRSVSAQPLKPNNIFIQTDKPIYKPGQKLRMRILSLDKDLKLTGDKVANVHVVASASRIKQWNDVKLEDGMASLELQLSKEPILGKYTITAFVGKARKTQTIEVAKYVLPKYEVKITPPAYMALDQKEFTTTICAKYTYGKNVKGTLNAVLCLKHDDYIYRRREYVSRNFKKCQNITREINGCTDIRLLREELNVGEVTNVYRTQFLIDAQVTETLTGVTLKSKALKYNMKRRSVQLSFSGTSGKFKPGLPFKYVLKVTRPDGSPATGARVHVTVSRGWSAAATFYNKTFVVTNGLITDSIDDATYNARSLVFKANLLDKNPYPVKAHMYPVSTSYTANPWYSPSFSYLEIHNTQNTPAKIDSEASLTVRYTVRSNTGTRVNFHYTIMCKGNTVKSGTHTQLHNYVREENLTTTATPATTIRPTKVTVNVTNATLQRTNDTIRTKIHRLILPDWGWRRPKPIPVKKLNERPVVEKFDIKFLVTMEMVPSCRMMVYYVREDKEVVADSVDFDVEDKLENQVSVSFKDDERKPGEETNLILKATPGSRVAFVAVDKSIHLLKAGNELTKEKILPYLRTYQQRAYNSNPKCRNSWNPWWRGKRSIAPFYWGDSSSYDDASDAFNVAGLIFLSDLSIFTKPCPRPRPVPVVMAMMVDDDGGVGRNRNAGPRPKSGNVDQTEKKKKEKPVRVRKEFPETWFWADEKLDESGNKTLQVRVPDTITTWVANGFAISSKTGLGISDTSTLKAFQPFFVQMTLPYSVIRGEEIPVTVTVFNYMTSCVPIKLLLNQKSPDYKVTSYYINKLCVCGDAGQSVKFTIIPTNLGHIPLTVTATTSSARLCSNSTVTVSDAVTRKLLVE